MSARHCGLVAGALVLAVLMGCVGDPRVTDPPRTAVEQLLLSNAADRALALVDAKALAGKKVFLDTTAFVATDKEYPLSRFRTILGRDGALLVEDKKDAEVIASVACGALSIDRSDSLLGIPSVPIPVPGVTTFQTPEVALFKSTKQTGIAKFTLVAVDSKTGKQVLAHEPYSGTTYHNAKRAFFFLSYSSTDIPEKRRKWWHQP